MTILSDKGIRLNEIVRPIEEPGKQNGMSYGLSHCGYDCRADLTDDQVVDICMASGNEIRTTISPEFGSGIIIPPGKSALFGVREFFAMPLGIAGYVRDKSTWARRGLMVNQGVLEPGWHGHLSVRVFNVGPDELSIINGDPICQVVFHWIESVPERTYGGKYQGQKRGAHGAKFDG